MVELREQPLDRLAEILHDRPFDVGVRKGPHVVLQAAELGDDVGWNDVRPRREQLAELDEGRTELVEHLAQVPAARSALRRRIGGLVALDRIAEPVPNGDLGDLAQTAEASLLRAGCHGQSVT